VAEACEAEPVTSETVGSGAVLDGEQRTVFDNLVDQPIDERAILEATAQTLVSKLRTIDQEYALARQAGAPAERTLQRFLKTQQALERCLKMLGSTPASVERLRPHLQGLANIFEKHATSSMVVALSEYDEESWFECDEPKFEHKITEEEYDNRRKRFEAKWRIEIGGRMARAMRDALGSAELKALVGPLRPNALSQPEHEFDNNRCVGSL
jgi:hypothetical protein